MTKKPNWIFLALVNSVLIQASTYLSRPMITYRLLELHSNNLLVGFYGALYVLFPLLLAIPLGHWVNHHGEGRFVFFGTVMAIVSTLGLMISHSVIPLGFFVVALGSSQFLCMVGSQAMVSNRSPNSSFEKYFGYYTFSASLGQMIGPAIGSASSGSAGLLPKSTSHGFLAAAILAGVALIPVLSWVVMKPTHAMTAKESRSGMSFTSVMSNPGMKTAMFTSMIISSSIDVFTVFLPVFGRDKGFTSTAIAGALVARAAASMISRFFLGFFTKRIGYQRLFLGSITLSCIACAVAAFSSTVLFLTVVMFVAGFTLGVGQPMTMAWVSRKSPENERSFAISIRLAGNRFGQFMMPMIAGVVAGPLGAGAVFLVIAGLVGTTAPLVKKSLT